MRSASTPVVIASLAAMVGHVVAQPQPPFMPLGPAAPAPVGYLDFCAKSPDQCALKNEVDPLGQPIGVEERSHQLRAKYFWSVFFGSGQPSNIGLSPAAGASTRPTPAARSPGGRYDWSAIFDASGPSEGPPTVATERRGGERPSPAIRRDATACCFAVGAGSDCRRTAAPHQPCAVGRVGSRQSEGQRARRSAAAPDRVLYGQEGRLGLSAARRRRAG